MPWEEKTVERSRAEFVQAVKNKQDTFSEICMEYGISRKTGYKWLNRFERGEDLSNKSRVPFNTPNKTPYEIEQHILEQREAHPAWGARKIKYVLEKKGYECIPAVSTICAILKRNGYVSVEESKKHKPYQRFERKYPNDLWQTDFKGDFGMGNSQRCHPLTSLDDNSRYSICVDAKDNERFEGVYKSFDRLFREFGLPKNILCDNGNPWGTSQSVGYTKFEVWLMELGIMTIHGRVRHPQTQGKEERFHRTMDDELLKLITIKDLEDAQKRFNEFRWYYNTERPHEALNYDTPSKHYRASTRKMPEKIEPYEYERGYEVRKIKSTGFITYRGQGYFLSEAFGNKEVAVRECEESGCVDIFYREFRIGRIDVDERVIVSRRIYRGKD